MADYTQEDRPLKIDTVLGTDALLLAGIRGEEAISRPFRFQLELVSTDLAVDAATLLRTPAVITLPLHDGSERTIHAVFSRFSQTGREEDLALYSAEVVAWPWFLSLKRNSRVFQEKSVLEIAESIFQEWGFNDFDVRAESRPAREFVVQYNESDLDFVARWLETEGIHYFFEHEADRHLLVLADQQSTFQPCPNVSEARLRGRAHVDTDVLTSLTREHAVQVGRVTLRHYDYLQPSLSLEASLEGDGYGEIFEYPASFTTPSEGERLARYRLEAEEARLEEVEGEGNCRWMVSGHTFEVLGHFNPATNGEYVITAVRHEASAGGFRAGEAVELDYRNSFRCIPSTVRYRPLRTTPRPVVMGAQTAVVVGPAGEEIWTDKYGRVKVQFHWDREGTRDENSSCWVRVSSPWGGKGYGGISIPRIGNEVVVSFLEGDPDQPIIVGSVYNAEQMPPMELPGAGIQMGMKSRSSPGGGGYNEISMTDTKGKEQMTVHAQFDSSITVGNDETHSVGNNRSSSVAVDESISIGANQTVAVGGNQSTTVAGNQDLGVDGDQSVTVGGSRSVSVGGDEAVDVGGGQTVTVGADRAVDVGANDTISAGADMEHTAGANLTLAAGANLAASADANAELTAGAEVTIEAGTKITLSAGGSMIEIGPDGITIQTGAIVTVQGATIKLN